MKALQKFVVINSKLFLTKIIRRVTIFRASAAVQWPVWTISCQKLWAVPIWSRKSTLVKKAKLLRYTTEIYLYYLVQC